MIEIDAKGLHYRDLNRRIKNLIRAGEREFYLYNINGQRYIGDGVKEKVNITIDGVPGNDLGAFMDGPRIVVKNNAQDAVANTMNSGEIIIHGDAGDVLGYGMRGGRLFIRGDVGYRVGIHMKAYQGKTPLLIVGGGAMDFLGEYMAGGIIIVLGMNRRKNRPLVGSFVGTGMHGGVIYLRGEVEPHQLGKEVKVFEVEGEEKERLRGYLEDYCSTFGMDIEEVMSERFVKLIPYSHRPYGVLYAY
ncbi:MAG TPA: hypothetical protein ENI32_02475 [Candidatus Syntrophoarchaeum butanivorans]|uniref:Glutamate synthase alpha subunit C-terminal domain-containing protein n=1 Tax=Candidatus Syntropharchaeum butanivorans TaxID=1839936 RepID=A0A7J2S203_9EURY|nr:hypothetical protein [Candidatus Syntrophoarchaeum butanivorans]